MPRKWSSAARERRRLRAVERGFVLPVEPGRAHISVPRALKNAAKQVCRSLEVHAVHDNQVGRSHHYARNATFAAWSAGHISEDEAKQCFSTHRAACRAKHNISAPAVPCGVSVSSLSSSTSLPPASSCEVFDISDGALSNFIDTEVEEFCPSILALVQVPDFFAVNLAFARLAQAVEALDATETECMPKPPAAHPTDGMESSQTMLSYAPAGGTTDVEQPLEEGISDATAAGCRSAVDAVRRSMEALFTLADDMSDLIIDCNPVWSSYQDPMVARAMWAALALGPVGFRFSGWTIDLAAAARDNAELGIGPATVDGVRFELQQLGIEFALAS